MIHENIMYITHSKRQKMGEEKRKKKLKLNKILGNCPFPRESIDFEQIQPLVKVEDK